MWAPCSAALALRTMHWWMALHAGRRSRTQRDLFRSYVRVSSLTLLAHESKTKTTTIVDAVNWVLLMDSEGGGVSHARQTRLFAQSQVAVSTNTHEQTHTRRPHLSSLTVQCNVRVSLINRAHHGRGTLDVCFSGACLRVCAIFGWVCWCTEIMCNM